MSDAKPRRYIVYEARLPDGSVYVGRTGSTLEMRRGEHEAAALRGSPLPFHAAIRSGAEVVWTVAWEGSHYHQSMGKEIAQILKRKREGVVLLNRTRGGFYDKYDRRRAAPPAWWPRPRV